MRVSLERNGVMITLPVRGDGSEVVERVAGMLPVAAPELDESLASAERALAIARAELGNCEAARKASVEKGDPKGVVAADRNRASLVERLDAAQRLRDAAAEIARARADAGAERKAARDDAAVVAVRRFVADERAKIEDRLREAIEPLAARWAFLVALDVATLAGVGAVQNAVNGAS